VHQLRHNCGKIDERGAKRRSTVGLLSVKDGWKGARCMITDRMMMHDEFNSLL
jgi:hypothetical protein